MYAPLVIDSSATVRRAASSSDASQIAMPVLTWPRHDQQAVGQQLAQATLTSAAAFAFWGATSDTEILER